MCGQDMVERLPLGNEWRKQFANFQQPFRICADTDPGIPKLLLVGCVSSVGRVVSVVSLAGFLLLAAGADIGRLLQFWTVRRLITGTQGSAVIFPAELAAVNAGVDCFRRTQISAQTGLVSKTIVLIISPAMNKDTMVSYLSGDGGSGTIEGFCNVCKRLFMNQGALNKGALR